MELIAALLAAGPLGYFANSSRQGLVLYLLVWAAIFPIQTLVVYDAGDQSPLYWVFNALILALGVALNRLGRRRREASLRGKVLDA